MCCDLGGCVEFLIDLSVLVSLHPQNSAGTYGRGDARHKEGCHPHFLRLGKRDSLPAPGSEAQAASGWQRGGGEAWLQRARKLAPLTRRATHEQSIDAPCHEPKVQSVCSGPRGCRAFSASALVPAARPRLSPLHPPPAGSSGFGRGRGFGKAGPAGRSPTRPAILPAAQKGLLAHLVLHKFAQIPAWLRCCTTFAHLHGLAQ